MIDKIQNRNELKAKIIQLLLIDSTIFRRGDLKIYDICRFKKKIKIHYKL